MNVKKTTITTKSGLLRALGLLKEDSDEESKKQKKMSREVKKVKKISEEEKEGGEGEEAAGDDLFGSEEGGEEGGEESAASDTGGEAEGGEEEKPKGKKELPGAKDLRKSPFEVPETVTGLSVIDRVNKIRAGSSMKDEKVMKNIDDYVTSLPADQAATMYTYLDALARIILGGMDPSEVPIPKGGGSNVVKGNGSQSTKKSPQRSDGLPIVSPVTVGEGVKRKLKEIDVPVRNGRLVPFGSKSHLTDLQGRIEDLERIRSYQERGSDTHHAMGLAIRALKNQLKAASRMSTGGNPRVQPMPPIVEKDK